MILDQQGINCATATGERIGFVRLVDEWQDMVYNTALGIVQNAEDADDIARRFYTDIPVDTISLKVMQSYQPGFTGSR